MTHRHPTGCETVNDQDKQRIFARYREEKERGARFFPDIIYKDAVVSFAIFILLIGLAAFAGVPGEPPADPSDANYVPRPEWYFLFLFEMLKFFPGQVEFIGTLVIPGAGVLALLLLPFFDRRLTRHPLRRPLASGIMSAVVVAVIALTVRAVATTPPQPETFGATYAERLAAGEDLDLTVRAYNCLKRTGITKVGEILEKLERSEEEILSIRNFGQKSLDELKEKLAAKGYWPLPAE